LKDVGTYQVLMQTGAVDPQELLFGYSMSTWERRSLSLVNVPPTTLRVEFVKMFGSMF
jgi:hypothetical protein